MRWTFFLVLLMSALPAQAKQSSEEYKTQIYKMVYNMCRGAGYAYELDPQYASQRDRRCVEETDTLISEFEVRYIYHQQFEQAMRRRSLLKYQGYFLEGDAGYYAENENAARSAFQNTIYIDYCIQKDQLRRGHVHEGQCGFVDQRVLDGPWKPIADLFEQANLIDEAVHKNLRDQVNNLFSQNIVLPLPINDLVSKLEAQGFTCETSTLCRVDSLMLPYKDGKLVALGGLYIGYKFTLRDNMVIGAEAYSGGGGL